MKFSIIKKGNVAIADEISNLFYHDEDPIIAWEDVKEAGWKSHDYLIVLETETEGIVGCAIVEQSCFIKGSPNDQLIDGEEVLVICKIGVPEKYQGSGYGRAMFEHIASLTNYPIVLSCIWSAYRFWLHLGFLPVQEGDEDDQTWLYWKHDFKNQSTSKNAVMKEEETVCSLSC